jgi:hypothetical protein
MDVNSAQVEILEKMDKLESEEKIIDFELEVKIEKPDEKVNIKTEVFEETNNSKLFKIIGEKRHFNEEKSNLENKNKKIKEEFVVFEESEYKKGPDKITEILLDDLNNQVFKIRQHLFKGVVIVIFEISEASYG